MTRQQITRHIAMTLNIATIATALAAIARVFIDHNPSWALIYTAAAMLVATAVFELAKPKEA